MNVQVIDAFTSRPFEGNPAAVCLLSEMPDETLMQAIAAEMNLSETAFVVPEGEQEYRIRWFTPAAEVDLCGHATLASAHALWESGQVAGEEISFVCKSGRLGARRDGETIVLDFPAKPAASCDPPEGLLEALGVARPEHVARSQYDYLVVLKSAEEVRKLAPDFGVLTRVKARGVIVTAPAEDGAGHDFVSRFFAPAVGVNEDPVTGSAHCCLAVYWSERLGKSRMLAHQASRRGGEVRVEHRGDRVDLGGSAVTVMSGTLAIPT